MSEFNDPELETLLGRAGGAYPDVNVAYEQLHQRVRHARRRRAVVVSGVACSLLFATALVAVNRTGNSSPSQIGDRETFEVTVPDNTTEVTTDNTVTDTINDSPNDSSVPETHGGSATPATTSASTTPGSGSNPTSSPPETTAVSPTTSVFSGDGGTITVRLQDGALTLVSYTTTSGFSTDIQHSSGDRVEVRFESSSHRTRIRIDLESGSMVPSIEENET